MWFLSKYKCQSITTIIICFDQVIFETSIFHDFWRVRISSIFFVLRPFYFDLTTSTSLLRLAYFDLF